MLARIDSQGPADAQVPSSAKPAMCAIVLVGGNGTRLRPYTAVMPKPLLPLGRDLSILGILLRQLAEQGFHRVKLAAGSSHSHLIRNFARAGTLWDVSIEYIEESSPLGTVGPLLQHIDRLPDHFLVVNGDILTDLDFAALMRHHMVRQASLTVATYKCRSSVDFGVVESSNGRIIGFREKPQLFHNVSMGVYALSRSALGQYPAGRSLGFDEFVLDLLARGEAVHAFPWDGYWLDIGRPADYERANKEFVRFRPQLLPGSPCSAPAKPGSDATAKPSRSGVLVLGASGFLGRHIAQAFAQGGIFELAISHRGRPGNVNGSVPHLELDLATASVAELVTILHRIRPAIVVNCAGIISGQASDLVEVNVGAVGNLVEAIIRSGTGIRLIHIGSAAEYGPAESGTVVGESSPRCPVSLYGATKLAASNIVLQAVDSGKLDAAVLRIFNPVGPGAPASSRCGRVAAEIRRALAVGDDVHLGKLAGYRDFVDVRDAAHAAVRASTSRSIGVLNIARGEAIPLRQMVAYLLDAAGYRGAVHEDAARPERSAGTGWQQADISRAVQELGWTWRLHPAQSACDFWNCGGWQESELSVQGSCVAGRPVDSRPDGARNPAA